MKKIVVALGGNAILTDDPSAHGQQAVLKQTAQALVSLIQQGHQVIISHGNGPQVGNLLLQQAAADSEANPAFPLDSCVAMTQGSIGYWLQQALRVEMDRVGLDQQVVSLVSQVVVDKNDPAFDQPTKPIGLFYSQDQADQLAAASGDVYVEDAGRGYRKVVPSPLPLDIVEAPVISQLVDQGVVVIAGGGGGIPVIQTDQGYEGVEAVIDKDFASAKLAEIIGADELLILTAEPYAYLNYGSEDQDIIEEVTAFELRGYAEEGHFSPGSMLPKVKACVQFAERCPHGQAVISSLQTLDDYLQHGSATRVKKSLS